MCHQSLEGKIQGAMWFFGRDAGVVLEAVFSGKAKEVNWGIPCVGVEEVGG